MSSTMKSKSSPMSSAAFRLQPRNLKCIPSPSHGSQDTRGRKRGAHSLNEDSPMSPSLGTTGCESFHTACTLNTTKDSTRYTDSTLPHFQGLSLHSPISTSYQTSQPLFESPLSFVGSQCGRSSFLRYSAGSPQTHQELSSPSVSGSVMSKSSTSPRRATCTVIFGQQCQANPTSTDLSASASPFKSNRSISPLGTKRPPLHHSGLAHLMQSLDETTGRAELDDLIESPSEQFRGDYDGPPLSTVHCQSRCFMASPNSYDSRLTESTPTNLLSTPCSKHSRYHELDSPARRSVMSFSTPLSKQTPLPRLTLTPRSTGSQRTRGSELPAFPMDLEKPDAPSSTEVNGSFHEIATPPSIIRHDAKKSGSFLPQPDWDEPVGSEAIMKNAFRGRSSSLLKPPRLTNEDPLEQIIAARTHQSAYDDNDSLSASDDEDDFFLAAPSVINEERKVNCQLFKQRKVEHLNQELQRKHSSSGPSLNSGLASNPSLLGMDFITSSSNLQMMDRVGSKVFSQGSFDEHPPAARSFATSREPSLSSIGLTFDACNNSSNNLAESNGGARELKTPPTERSQTESPPPLHLSKKDNRFDDHCLFHLR